jgi:formamidopyrimidine-DNA glycosylase
MPELPEVETMVRQLRPRLVGRTVTSAAVHWPRTVARPSARRFREGVSGRRIEALGRRGKYFLFDFDDGRSLVGHLRMSGRLFLVEPGEQDRRAEHTRASFDLDDGRRLVFVDVRKFGRLALVRRPEEAMPALGPEPLSPEVDGAWMATALRSRRRMLKPLLLDQSFLAGLGNIYVDESLHRAGLHPLRLSDRVPRAKAEALAAAIREVLTAAIEADGSSFDTFYRTPEGQPGRFQDTFMVYGRHGKPCRTCGATIHRIVVGQRGTHLCPRCQSAPRNRR